MRCLVTGASGLFGAALTRRLVDEGCQVAVLLRRNSNHWRLNEVLDQISIIRGDLTELQAAGPSIRDFGADTVFHLGWAGVERGQRDSEDQDGNVEATLRLIEFSQAGGCRVWVGIGSQAEYGPRRQVLREDLSPAPVTMYGAAKVASCYLAKRTCERAGIRFVWLRLLALYGPQDDSASLIPTVIGALLAGLRPAVTAGIQRYDYLYVDDAVEALWRVVQTPEAAGIFNLASGQARVVRTIIEQIRDLIDPSQTIGFGEQSYGPEGPFDLEADVSLLTRATGWRPMVSLSTGLARVVDWHQAQARRPVRRGTPDRTSGLWQETVR